MSFSTVDLVYVYYIPRGEKILVGRIALNSRRIFFEYDEAFLKLDLNISPFKLPSKSGVFASEDMTFDGLFGVFNDSLPDGWGKLLLDRALTKHHINPSLLSPLDRLCFVGKHGMGALIYEPVIDEFKKSFTKDLDEIADEVQDFQGNNSDQFVEDLLDLGGSSAGARPKVLLSISGDEWIIKFRSTTDLEDISSVEYAYYLMAKEAGLELSEAKLFPSRNGIGYFGMKRFDVTSNSRIHMHSLSGLIHADHRIPNLDYETILKASLYLTRDERERDKLFRQCVFNVLTHNRDDHSKNFSFLMNEHGEWRVSPSYDLTFSSGPGGEHCSTIMGEGKKPDTNHLLGLAAAAGINPKKANTILEEVKDARSRWLQFADNAGVSKSSREMIKESISSIS